MGKIAYRHVSDGRVLVIHRNLPPILARAVDVTKCPDWATIRADIQAIRAGSPPINPTSYAPTAPGQATATMPAGVPRW